MDGPAEHPYVAVIFTSQRRLDVQGDDGYIATSEEMERLAEEQPGYLGIESAHDAGGFGITVSYWMTQDHARAWKRVAEHAAAQKAGRDRWYEHYIVRVATVEREYGWSTDCS